jgi:hypothetical protein
MTEVTVKRIGGIEKPTYLVSLLDFKVEVNSSVHYSSVQ